MAGGQGVQATRMALVMVLLTGTDGLRCYSCSSGTDHPCRHNPAQLGQAATSVCDSSSDSCVTEYSYSITNKSVTEFGRHCGYSLSCIGCIPLPNTDKAVCTTCCTTDLCNTDTAVTSGTTPASSRHFLFFVSPSLTTILLFVNNVNFG